MAISDLYSPAQYVRNLSYFSSMVNLAAVDGAINPEEGKVLKRLADKLNLAEDDYQKALESPSDFPVAPPNTSEERLERLYLLLTVIFADSNMTPKEEALFKKYAIAIGFSPETSQKIISRSIQILSGKLSFEDYLYLLNRKE